MLAYAAHRPVIAERRSAPNAMLAIIALHVAAVAALMSARMDLPQKILDRPLTVDLISEDDPPPPRELTPEVPARPQPSTLDQRQPLVPTPPTDLRLADATPTLPDLGAIVGPKTDPQPKIDPLAVPAKVAARLITPSAELRPPYPHAKLLSGEEAALRLRLTIDERGRVVAVEPLGRADRTFLDAARRHLMARWRYQPAMDNGKAVATTAVVMLRFQLEG